MAIDFTKPFSEIVEDLARRVERNGLTRIDPERFHAEKSEITNDLRRLAGKIRANGRRTPTTVWRHPSAR